MTEPSGSEAPDELYANPPGEFVARRDALAGQARAAGDRARAAAIKALRRPSVGAWYLNTAARAGLVSLRELLRLGDDLRAAQAGGEIATLRDLAARRGPLVSRVVRDVTAHLAQLGVAATPAGLDEVRATLAAALADPEVADLVVRGRLDRRHDYSGFGGAMAVPTAPAAPGPPAGRSASAATPSEPAAADPAAEARTAAAEAAVAESEAELEAAVADRGTAEQSVTAAQARVDTLLADLTAAREQLAAAEAALAGAAERERTAGEAVEQARSALAPS